MKSLPIKLKISIWFALLMLVFTMTLLSLLMGIGRRVLGNATEAELMATVEQSRASAEYEYGVLDFDDDLKFFDNGVMLSVFDEKQRLLYGRSLAGFHYETPFESGVVRLVSDYYVYDMFYRQEGYGAIWIRGVLSAQDDTAAFTVMIQVACILLPLMVVLSAVGAYFLTRQAFFPVQKITDTALQISQDGALNQRIPVLGAKDEIGKLASAFNIMFDSLQTAFEKEQQFTSDASHELRTPASLISMECEEALSQHQTAAEARQTIEHIQKHTLRVQRLIAELLNVARADQHNTRLEIETLNLAEIARNVSDQFAETALCNGITLTPDIADTCMVSGDETLLARLIWNLLENAGKYNKANGSIKIILRADNQTITCIVEDTGIGIAPDDIPKIWKRFWRADESRSSDGFGLGLPLCKYIAQAHGGSITVKSVRGVGSEFIFILPQKK